MIFYFKKRYANSPAGGLQNALADNRDAVGFVISSGDGTAVADGSYTISLTDGAATSAATIAVTGSGTSATFSTAGTIGVSISAGPDQGFEGVLDLSEFASGDVVCTLTT